MSVVSDSVRPHRRQPTKLPNPWDSPGKSTGVGCHCLLPYLFTSLPKSLTSSHLWDANDHPPLPGRRGEKTLTTGGPGKEQGTNKLPPTRILQRSTRGDRKSTRLNSSHHSISYAVFCLKKKKKKKKKTEEIRKRNRKERSKCNG